MSFEEFTRNGGKPDRMEATITKSGAIYFTNKAFDAMGRPDGARFFFDKENYVIGILPSDRKNKNAFAVSSPVGQRSHCVSAKSFLATYEIGHPVSLCRPVTIGDDGMLLIDLKDNGRPVFRGRR